MPVTQPLDPKTLAGCMPDSLINNHRLSWPASPDSLPPAALGKLAVERSRFTPCPPPAPLPAPLHLQGKTVWPLLGATLILVRTAIKHDAIQRSALGSSTGAALPRRAAAHRLQAACERASRTPCSRCATLPQPTS
jgi:hypothetical protein